MLAMMPFRLLCLSSSPLHISIKPMTCWNGVITFTEKTVGSLCALVLKSLSLSQIPLL